MSATTESGTPPRSPRWPSGTRNCCRHLQIAARGVLELDTDRHLTVAGVEFGERRADVADGGDADGLRQAFGGDAEARRKLGARTDPQFGPVERGFRDHVGDDRNPLHLGREFARDIADDVAVGAGDDQRDRTQGRFRQGTRSGWSGTFSSSWLIDSSSSRWVILRAVFGV